MPEKEKWKEVKDRNRKEVLEPGSYDAPSCILALVKSLDYFTG